MKRRQALAVLGTGLTGGIAGCSGGGGDDAEATTESPTPTETSTATPTATATATQTATPTPSAPTHGLGEAFTVGSGDSAVEYTFRQFYRAQELGPTRTEQASDTFLLVILTVTNPRSETIDVPTPNIKLRASGIIANVDRNASQAAGSDDRLDVKSIATATVSPNDSITGVIVYDAPTGHDYRIQVAPTGSSGEAHYVSVGDIADVEPLTGGY